jgi:hypothetical protein
MESEFGLEIGDDDWWKEAEKRVLRDTRRARRRARTKHVARWLPVALVVVLVGAAGIWAVREDRLPAFPDMRTGDGPLAGAALPLTDADLRAPFITTPAAAFPTGEASLILPAPKPVGRHSALTVAGHLRTAKRLLFLSRLDPRMVERRDPAAFLAALAPAERKRGTPLFALNHDDALVWGTRVAPGSTMLAPPRFSGAMSVRLGKYGEVVVATDYVFVYALKPPGPVYDATETHVIVRAQVAYSFLYDRRWSDADQGVALADSSTHYSNVDCGQSMRGLLALPTEGRLTSPMFGEADGRSREDYYRTDMPVPTSDSCLVEPRPAPKPTDTARPV